MALNVKGLEGNEIADDYIRNSVPTSRWGDTWDLFKSNFGKLVLINIFMLIFFIPAIVLMWFRTAYIAGLGSVYPFNASVIYPFYPDTTGLAEGVQLSADLIFYAVLIAAGFIASIGIAGGAYSIRKLINTHGKFTVKGFFHGVRVCYFNTLVAVTLFLAFVFLTVVVGDYKEIAVATGSGVGGWMTAYVFIIIATVLVGLYCMWFLAVGTGYRLKPLQLLKNPFVLMIGTPIQTVLMAGIALIPLWLLLIFNATGVTFLVIIVYIIFIFFGFSLILLIWLAFTQWAFDLFVTPNVQAAKEEANAAKSPKQIAQEKHEEEQRVARELLAAGRSELIARPILPVSETVAVNCLGMTFSRADIAEADCEREKLKSDVAAYEKEHENDPVYAEYNKMFAEREKALQTEDKKGKKKKKISADNMLR